jgi:hypothetical protein
MVYECPRLKTGIVHYILQFVLCSITCYSCIQALLILAFDGGSDLEDIEMDGAFIAAGGYILAALIGGGFAAYNIRHGKNYKTLKQAFETGLEKVLNSLGNTPQGASRDNLTKQHDDIIEKLSGQIGDTQNNGSLTLQIGDTKKGGNLTHQHDTILTSVEKVNKRAEDDMFRVLFSVFQFDKNEQCKSDRSADERS